MEKDSVVEMEMQPVTPVKMEVHLEPEEDMEEPGEILLTVED